MLDTVNTIVDSHQTRELCPIFFANDSLASSAPSGVVHADRAGMWSRIYIDRIILG